MNTWMKGAHSKRSVGLSLPLAILTALVAAVAVLLFALSSTAQAEIPVPGDDVYTIKEGNPLLVGLDGGGGSVLNNDTDLEGDPLQAFLDQVPSHGIVDQFNPDGSFSYFPAPDYNGDDSFTYVASDGSTTPENLNKATVHIHIESLNDPPSFSGGGDVTVEANSGTYTAENWATNISPGPPDESLQNVTFNVANDNTNLFSDSDQPAVSPSGTLTFTPKANATGFANVFVTAKDDGGTANGGIDTSLQTYTFTIRVNPPPPPALSIDNAQATEGIDSAAIFTVRLSGPSLQPVEVNFNTDDDTAIASADYEATHLPITIPPGQTQANVPVGIIDDTQHEETETFKVSVFSPDTANSGGIGVGTILDNDTVLPPPDTDGDGVADDTDNCPIVSNPNQADTDGDGQGNVCDGDVDGDSVNNEADNCPLHSNPEQLDTDGDGTGNACDADDDGDGVTDANDNCPIVSNPGQADTDGDGMGDACEPPDATAPKVTQTYPATINGILANKTDNITAKFSEAVKGVSPTTFKLEQVTTNKKGVEVLLPVTAKVTTIENDTKAVLDPTKALQNGGTYRATLTDGVTDKAGNALAPSSWKFTVAKR